MTIDEAIQFCTETAADYMGEAMQYNECDEWEWVHKCANEEYAANYRQLADWLKELLQRREWCAQYEVEQISNLEQYDMLSREYEILNERYKEAVRLLKAAVEDFSEIKSCLSEPYSRLCDKWRYTDEALKLIGDEPSGI